MSIETHLFYFSEAAHLRRYISFSVLPTSQARPGQTPDTVTLYMVVGQVRDEDRTEVIAEFPLELHAEIFRDMATATAHSI
jgi:hypothetical protein